MADIVFITWAKTVPRSKNIGKRLGAECFFVEYLKNLPKVFLPIRYGLQGLRTLQILLSHRPKVVMVANPPIFLPLLAYAYITVFGGKFVIDSHTGAFDLKGWGRLIPIHKFLSSRALTTIVTNRPLSSVVKCWPAPVFVLEDALPILQPPSIARPQERFSVCVVNSFSEDEPLDEILTAAKASSDCDFYITGKIPKDKLPLTINMPKNICFTGFLPDPEYIRRLYSVNAIMVLVKYDMTMLCGAYEAVAVGKPLITSDWKVLKHYFSKGTIYVDNSPEQIKAAVEKMKCQLFSMTRDMASLKLEISARWERSFKKLVQLLKSATEKNAYH
jgi:glycosyltransferase involved in cell wall biosynthesis